MGAAPRGDAARGATFLFSMTAGSVAAGSVVAEAPSPLELASEARAESAFGSVTVGAETGACP